MCNAGLRHFARANHIIQLEGRGATSREFSIGLYPPYQDELLLFMRQQRCGYNPYLDMVCHTRDGRTVYAPIPDGSFMDASGGWHDAGDTPATLPCIRLLMRGQERNSPVITATASNT